MAVMRLAGTGHHLPAHAHVREDDRDYLIELDVADFLLDELKIEALGRLVTVRAEQGETSEDEGLPFRLRERLEQSFRLPDDADVAELAAHYRSGMLELRAPRTPLTPREIPVSHAAPRCDPDASPS